MSRRPMSGRRLLVALLVILVLAIVPSVVVPTLMCRSTEPGLLFLGEVPAFSLTDERGEAFTEAALRGHVTIVSFLFTRCDTICPVTTLKMGRLQEKTFDAKGAVKLVSFSVDPAYDTPARLAEYAQRYRADPTRWRFVTGPVEAVRSLVEGAFMNTMQRDGSTPSGAPNIAHSGRFMLIDSNLQIRGAYDSGDIQRLDELVHDALYLVRTQQ